VKKVMFETQGVLYMIRKGLSSIFD